MKREMKNMIILNKEKKKEEIRIVVDLYPLRDLES